MLDCCNTLLRVSRKLLSSGSTSFNKEANLSSSIIDKALDVIFWATAESYCLNPLNLSLPSNISPVVKSLDGFSSDILLAKLLV